MSDKNHKKTANLNATQQKNLEFVYQNIPRLFQDTTQIAHNIQQKLNEIEHQREIFESKLIETLCPQLPVPPINPIKQAKAPRPIVIPSETPDYKAMQYHKFIADKMYLETKKQQGQYLLQLLDKQLNDWKQETSAIPTNNDIKNLRTLLSFPGLALLKTEKKPMKATLSKIINLPSDRFGDGQQKAIEEYIASISK
jgi:hypothetical protein